MTAPVQTTPSTLKPAPVPRNGINTPMVFATLDVIREQPQLAKFEFRATTRWLKGTHTRTTIDSFSGGGAEYARKAPFHADADHPAQLVGEDNGPTPMEIVLEALGACLVAGVASIAAARRVDLYEVVANVEGKADLRGVLGLSDEVRNGFQSIRVQFELRGDAPAEKLQQIVQQSSKRSAVFDIITNAVPVEIVVNGN
jgi:uncharacterized OsmC-like protein